MTKSDFTSEFLTIEEGYGSWLLSITDLNQGRMSVTNDAENVLSSIRKSMNMTIDQMRCVYIIYCDSDGRWDRMVYHDDDMVDFQTIDLQSLQQNNPALYKAIVNIIE